MKFFIYFICPLFIVGLKTGYAQEKPQFPPYNIESTYLKLKKKYPFVSPIRPVKSDALITKENIIYKKSSKNNLKLDVYIPKSKQGKNFTSILLIHGGGWLTGSKENQRIMAQNLALNGFVAITVSYTLGIESPYPTGVKDLKDAIKWMRNNAIENHIDPSKICVLGASAGGHLATLVGVTPNHVLYAKNSSISDEVQAIVNIDGIVSFIHPEASKEGKMASIWLNGTKSNNYKNWQEASPLEYVNHNTPPILFINSAQPRFHAGRDDMISLLNNYNIYHETHTIANAPHSFWLLNPWFETTLNHTINFLNRVFK